MFDIFYKGLLFVPAYACLVYAVIFLTNWKSLQTSQRIFAFALLAMINSSLQFVCLMINDVEACKIFVYTSSFASPTLISLLFLFVYSQMQTKSIFQLKLLPAYMLPFIPCAMLVLNRIIYGSGQTDVIAERIITDDDNIQITWLVELEYFIFKMILFVGDAVIILYSIYKIHWFESGLQKYMADTESKLMPLKKQLIMTLLMFVAVSLQLFIKHLVPREHFLLCAEIYGVFLMGLIIHTCRAVHHGYARIPIEGEDVDRMEAEMNFLTDSFDERTMTLIAPMPAESSNNGSESGTDNQETTGAKEAATHDTVQENHQPQHTSSAAANGTETEHTTDSTATKGTKPAVGSSSSQEGDATSPQDAAATPRDAEENPQGTAANSQNDAATQNADTGKRDVIEYVQSSSIEMELKRVMVIKKLYMQQNITIKDVANAIGTNHYYLSVYLNRVLNTSFSDYINRLRIEREVIPRMQKNPNISTKELIMVSNFSHRTTFYRAFQKVMGIPFHDYKATLKG